MEPESLSPRKDGRLEGEVQSVEAAARQDSVTSTTVMGEDSDREREKSNLVVPWVQTFAALLICVGSWGFLNTFGLYYYYYLENLTPSAEAISWIGIVQATLVVILGVLTGPIFDRGYLRELLIVGCFLTVFGMMMLSLSTKYHQVLLAQGICIGLGSGIIYIPSLAMVAASFEKPGHRAVALAIATSGAGVGGIIYPAALLRLIPRVGYAWATRVLGFITIGCFVVALAIIISRCKAIPSKPPRALIQISALRELPFAIFIASLFLIFLAYWAPLFQISTFAGSKLRQSEMESIYSLIIANGLTIPTRLVGALLVPVFGAPRTLVGVVFASAIVLFGWLGVETELEFTIWVAFFGLSVGPITVLIPTMLPNLSPPHLIGERMGLAWGFAALGSLLGVPMSAALNDTQTGEFWKSILLQAIAMTLGAVTMAYVAWILTQRSIAN